jgi:hypothetical protein
VTAAATAGPSGVAGISCSVDGGPAQWYGTATAQIPVSGDGEHVAQCFAENNAVDVNGASATPRHAPPIAVVVVAQASFQLTQTRPGDRFDGAWRMSPVPERRASSSRSGMP